MKKTRGASLIELLATLAVMAGAMSLGMGALDGWTDRQRPREVAEDFVRQLKEAREYARRNGVRVRLAYSPPRDPLQQPLLDDALPPANAFALFRFVVPEPAGGEIPWARPTAALERDDALVEPGMLSARALPAGFVGCWMPHPDRPLWTELGDSIRIEAEMLDRFTQQEFAEYAAENFYAPATVWDGAATRESDGLSNRSVFPANYAKTPYPGSVPLIAAPLPQSETVYDYVTGGFSPARTVWGKGSFPQFAVRAKHGAVDRKLPGIEFAPDGSLACGWTDELRLRFRPAARATPAYEIAIAAETGLARLLPP